MNRERRKQISEAQELLDQAFDILQTCLEEEQEYYDNIPENMNTGERADASETALEYLSEAIQATSDATNILGNIE